MIKSLITLLIGYIIGYVMCGLKTFWDLHEQFPDLYEELKRRVDE